MYNNGQTELLEKEETIAASARQGEKNTMRSNLDKIMNYEKYLGGNAQESARAAYSSSSTTVKKAYMSPTVEYVPTNVFAQAAEDAARMSAYTQAAPAPAKESEDLKPSSTTMQFSLKDGADIYEEIRPKSDEEKDYKINTKGKVLIAVYAIVILTIFSLILLNSRMLRNLDRSIDTYTSRVETLTKEYTDARSELDYVSSDETIISKAEEMGLIKG